MESGIYKIQSISNPNRCYIGSSTNFNKRWKLHLKSLKSNSHHSEKMQNHYNKYGINDFQFKVLLRCNKEELLIKEQYFIDSENPFFNICKIAGSPLGIKRSEETKQKLRNYMMGRTSAFKGKSHSVEAKQKLREFNLGKRHSEETKQKCSNIMKAHIRTPEHCKNLSLAKQTQSLETRQKISQANKGKRRTPEQKEKYRINRL